MADDTFRRIILWIIYVCLLIHLLPISDNENQSNARLEVLNDPFLIAHTLDPTYDPDKHYVTWSASDWIIWLDEREPHHKKASKNKREYRLNDKHINTVIIATLAEIKETFNPPLERFGSHYFWSKKDFITYDFKKRKSGYSVYRCLPTFIIVALKNGKPVHLHGKNRQKIAGNANNFDRKANCVEIL